MRIVVFGSTGGTGRLVVEEARRRGHQVVAVARRDPDEPFGEGVALVRAQPWDRSVIAGAVAGADAVLSALGPRAGETITEISDATRAIVGVLQGHTPTRLVVPGNASVFSDKELTGAYANVGEEHRRVVALVRESALPWSVLVAPILSDDPASGNVMTAIDERPPGRTLTRGDFAATMLDAIAHAEWVGHLVGVANAQPDDDG
jgi:uncharacterized protein YbjT (DUF2867 family)